MKPFGVSILALATTCVGGVERARYENRRGVSVVELSSDGRTEAYDAASRPRSGSIQVGHDCRRRGDGNYGGRGEVRTRAPGHRGGSPTVRADPKGLQRKLT